MSQVSFDLTSIQTTAATLDEIAAEVEPACIQADVPAFSQAIPTPALTAHCQEMAAKSGARHRELCANIRAYANALHAAAATYASDEHTARNVFTELLAHLPPETLGNSPTHIPRAMAR